MQAKEYSLIEWPYNNIFPWLYIFKSWSNTTWHVIMGDTFPLWFVRIYFCSYAADKSFYWEILTWLEVFRLSLRDKCHLQLCYLVVSTIGLVLQFIVNNFSSGFVNDECKSFFQILKDLVKVELKKTYGRGIMQTVVFK